MSDESSADAVYVLRQLQHACDTALARLRDGRRVHKSALGILVLARTLEERVRPMEKSE